MFNTNTPTLPFILRGTKKAPDNESCTLEKGIEARIEGIERLFGDPPFVQPVNV